MVNKVLFFGTTYSSSHETRSGVMVAMMNLRKSSTVAEIADCTFCLFRHQDAWYSHRTLL